MKANLEAIVPYQFGDHSHCDSRFCGYKRKPGEKYVHRSLPYKCQLKDKVLRQRLEKVFSPLINNAKQYIDLGSSQQCEHANKEVSQRAPKSHHYGNSASLEYRVQATAAFINDGRQYIYKTYSKMGLSPGAHTVTYATKCMKRRLDKLQMASLRSSKRRRLVLKQERSINQGAGEYVQVWYSA
ncbi:uncharacterized protein LOC127867740 isoform X2 [Dreissena polymorpha]|nr:uncharacterized protein LOC127867740 isoform X2 [Dreissena polymorpha]XP_052265062.1 uncharacterized protein LOC127867740 isoform X2 [Dreissena polymorpha]